MRTVSGTVTSSKPISLSEATSALSKFVSAHNGASQAMSAYLRRTLASLKELKQLYKGLHKSSSSAASPSGHKRKRRSSDVADDAQSEPNRKRHRR